MLWATNLLETSWPDGQMSEPERKAAHAVFLWNKDLLFLIL